MAKTEKYNLQRVLEMRERARDEAARYLAECRRQMALAEDELNNRRQAVEDCRHRQSEAQKVLTEKSSVGIKSGEIMRYRQHLIDLREDETRLLAAVEEQKSTVARAGQKVEKAFNDLSEAAKELKVIEKHRENWLASNKKEADRREQKSNDEIGAILHERHKFE